MYREILKDLKEWKDRIGRKPLLLTGVRQCGKTYILEKFARENFRSHVLINFEEYEKISAIFDFDFDVRRIISELELYSKTKIVPGETCVILDEIQECPEQ